MISSYIRIGNFGHRYTIVHTMQQRVNILEDLLYMTSEDPYKNNGNARLIAGKSWGINFFDAANIS